MKRRVTAGGKAARARRGKTPNLKRRRTAAVARSRASDANLKKQLDRRTGELAEARKLLAEALEQQRASAEVLNVISNSVSEAKPVFEKIVESCERIFATSRVGLNLIGPDGLVHAGAYGKFPGAEKLRRENFPHPVPGSATGAVISAGRPIQYPDALSDSDVPQYGRRAAEIVGFRAFIMAPLLSEGRGLGAIFVGRETVGSFSDKEIALLKTFAAQAVIAIENVRLFDEVQARTRELSQSISELRALGEVSQAVNSSIDLETVLTTIVAKATQLSDTEAGTIYVFDEAGQEFRLRATFGMDDAIIAAIRNHHIHMGETIIGRAAEQRIPVQIPDIQNDPSSVLDIIARAGFRALLAVPLLAVDRIVGALVVRRKEPSEFPKNTVDLLQTFGAQSVLAI